MLYIVGKGRQTNRFITININEMIAWIIACNFVFRSSRKSKRILQHRHEVTILAERMVASKKEQRMKEMQSRLSSSSPEGKPPSQSDLRIARRRTSTSSAKSN